MTIAVGFRCIDGVVLAADSQYTTGITKLSGSKIFPIASNGHYALTLAGAGGVPSLKGIDREIRKRLDADIGPNRSSFADIRQVVEDALRAYYPRHIDSAPKLKRPDLEVDLLVGLWVEGNGTQMLQTNRTVAFRADQHCCIGIGQHLAQYLIDVFLPAGSVTVRLAEALAAYIVGRAKKYVEFCGGGTQVRALLDDGTDERVWNEEVKASEAYFEDFFRNLRFIHGIADDRPVDLGPFVKLFNERAQRFQAEVNTCREKREAIRRTTKQ